MKDMIPMLLTAVVGASEPAPEIPLLVWDWSAPQRYYVESEVRLPELMWFNAEFNKDARVIGFQLRAVLACQSAGRDTARKKLIRCAFEDFSIVAGAVAGDRGRVQPIIDEYDALFDDALLSMVIRNDGRITDVNLEEVPVINLRTRGRKETLRLLTRFLAAGLEVPVSRRAEPMWMSSESLFCTLPTFFGTAGPVEAIHQGTLVGGEVEIATNARGLIYPGNGNNRYTCEYASLTTFDPTEGLVSRTWTMRGEPTASSPIAMGAAGYPYIQLGSARRLAPDEVVELPPTVEVVPSTDGPSALQQGGGALPGVDPSR